MRFDIQTVLASEAALCVLLTLSFLLAAFQLRDRKGSGFLALSFLSTACGISMFLLRAKVPLSINVPLSNSFYCISNALAYVGIATLLRVRPRLWFITSVAIVSTLSLAHFHAVSQTVLRIVIISAADLLLRANLCSLLVRKRRHGTVVKLLGAVIGFFMVCDILRIVATVKYGTSSHVFEYNVVQSAYITASLLMQCSFGVLSLTLIFREAMLSLERGARRDPLTNVLNRLGIEERLAQEFERARLSGIPFSMALVDVDNFKRFNDSDGHAAGDDVLRKVATCLTESLRRFDACGRLGGDEFLVIFPGLQAADSRIVCDHARAAIEAIGAYPQAGIAPSVSIGIAAGTGRETIQELMERADRALYAAKRLGKNRIEVELSPLDITFEGTAAELAAPLLRRRSTDDQGLSHRSH